MKLKSKIDGKIYKVTYGLDMARKYLFIARFQSVDKKNTMEIGLEREKEFIKANFIEIDEKTC